jgi:hypothetical protein
MEAAGNPNISQMVDEQGYLLRQCHDQLAQLGKAMEEVLSSVSNIHERL